MGKAISTKIVINRTTHFQRMGDFLLRAKQHYSFSAQERKELLITAVISGFVLSFRNWGTVTFDPLQGVFNWLVFSFFVAVFLFVHVSAQKLFAIKIGYKATYSYWLNGLLIGFVVAFISYGFIPVLLTGTVAIELVPRLRIGRFRYGLNYKDLAKIAFAGPLANILLIIILQPFLRHSIKVALPELGDFFFTLILINALIALYSLLPFKNTNGITIFGASRAAYIFCFFFVLICSLPYFVAYALELVRPELVQVILGTVTGLPFVIVSAIISFLIMVFYSTGIDVAEK